MKKFWILALVLGLSLLTACEMVDEPSESDDDPYCTGGSCNTIINPPLNDWDADTILNDVDNCPYVPNPNQENADGDAAGDACDCAPNNPNRWRPVTVCHDTDGDFLPEEGTCREVCSGNTVDLDDDETLVVGPPWDPCPNDEFNICVVGNHPPTVTGTNPVNNAAFVALADVTFSATATDPDPGDAVVRVDILFGNTVVCTDTGAPFGCSLNDLPAGTYRWRARAYDSHYASAVSAEYIFVVTPTGTGPTVTIMDPLTGDTFPYGANIPIAVTATYQYGTITSVTCYDGANLIGTDTTAPYTCTLTNASNGTHTLTARATASDGNTATSAPVTITVGPQPSLIMFFVDWAYAVLGSWQSTIYSNVCAVAPGEDDWDAYGPYVGHESPANRLECELNPNVFVTETAWLSIHVPGSDMNHCEGSDGTVFSSDWFPMGSMESLGSDTVHMMCSYLATGSPHFYLIQNGVVLDLQWRMVHLPSGFTYEINFATGTDPQGNEVPITAGITLDTDGDGINNALDNCIWMANPGQETSASNPVYDIAGHRAGDACQAVDSDNDTIYDWYDNFIFDWTQH